MRGGFRAPPRSLVQGIMSCTVILFFVDMAFVFDFFMKTA